MGEERIVEYLRSRTNRGVVLAVPSRGPTSARKRADEERLLETIYPHQ